MEKIIVFRPGALGDTLLAFPALAALRRAFPAAWLGAIGNAPALALARDAVLADEIIPFDHLCWADLFSEDGIRSAEARQTLAGANLAVLWLRDDAGLATRNLRALGIPLVLCAPGRPPDGARVHAAEYLLCTLAPIIGEAAAAPADMPTLAPAPEARAWAAAEWTRRGLADAPVLVVHPGSGRREKCWPPERFAELAGRFIAAGWQALVIEGPADGLVAPPVLAALPTGRAQRVAGLALPQLAALLARACGGGRLQEPGSRTLAPVGRSRARASLFVGNDSGVSHLSALLGVPTLALFGPTDPAIWAPRGPRARVVWAGAGAREVRSAAGSAGVSDGVTLPPMTSLSVDRVADAAWALLRPRL